MFLRDETLRGGEDFFYTEPFYHSESTGINVDYTLISAAGDTYNKIAVAAITTAVILLSLAI